MVDKVGLYSEQEGHIRSKFFFLCKPEYELLIKLLKHNESLIHQLNNKIKDTDRPEYSIELLLTHNLSLLNSSLNNLIIGYLGSSQIILRTVLENTCLSMYFFEFPKDEYQYRNNRKSFNCKLRSLGYDTWVEGWLKRIDNEGIKFPKLKGENNEWYNRIFTCLVKEASSFVHADLDFIYGLVYVNSDNEKSTHVLGPNWPNDLLVKNALWKIIEACLYSCAVLDRVFKQHITVIDLDLYCDAVDKLNNWKSFYGKS